MVSLAIFMRSISRKRASSKRKIKCASLNPAIFCHSLSNSIRSPSTSPNTPKIGKRYFLLYESHYLSSAGPTFMSCRSDPVLDFPRADGRLRPCNPINDLFQPPHNRPHNRATITANHQQAFACFTFLSLHTKMKAMQTRASASLTFRPTR